MVPTGTAPRPRRDHYWLRLRLSVIVTALVLVACTSGAAPARRHVPFGAFLGSGAEGVAAVEGFRAWLDGPEPSVGHTYLPGSNWSDIEQPGLYVTPWARWAAEDLNRLLVINIPLLTPNEPPLPDREVIALLDRGARGEFDRSFRILGEELVRLEAERAVLVLGWEMNGISYTHRCAPDPDSWIAYWRRVVTTMRAVPGQQFRFDFTPSRGVDAIAWTRCYPGDDVVDIVGMDSYDQPRGRDFARQRDEPYGLRAHADFAAAHGKPVSFPEWGLYRNGDDPSYTRQMLQWIESMPTVYQTITDYCPSGVYTCHLNPKSSAAYRAHYGAAR